MFYVLFFVGSCIASFLNVYVTRWPNGYLPLTSRSHCDQCHHQLKACDLIPLISYLVLKGRCRYCHHHISIREFLVECAGGIIAVVIYKQSMFSMETVLLFSIMMLFVMLSFIDIDHLYIDGKLIAIVSLLCFIYQLKYHPLYWIRTFCFASLLSIALFLLAKWQPMMLGIGDSQCYFVASLLVGYQYVLYLFMIANLTCLLAFIIRILNEETISKKPIAYAPFILLSAIVIFLFMY